MCSTGLSRFEIADMLSQAQITSCRGCQVPSREQDTTARPVGREPRPTPGDLLRPYQGYNTTV